MTLGQKIKKRREELKLTQSFVSRQVGVAVQTIFKYENEIVTNIPLSKIELLAKTLEVTPAYLMGWDDINGSTQKKNDTITDIILRLRTDAELLSLFTDIAALAPEQIKVVQATVGAFKQQQIDHID